MEVRRTRGFAPGATSVARLYELPHMDVYFGELFLDLCCPA